MSGVLSFTKYTPPEPDPDPHRMRRLFPSETRIVQINGVDMFTTEYTLKRDRRNIACTSEKFKKIVADSKESHPDAIFRLLREYHPHLNDLVVVSDRGFY